MNGWGIAGIVVGALVLIAFLFNLKDLVRYIKISRL